MSVLTEETIRYISEVFNGDKEDLFKYPIAISNSIVIVFGDVAINISED